jgi:hypothetical protein
MGTPHRHGAGKRNVAEAGQVLANVVELVERHGWAVVGVFPTAANPGPSFCYTVGASAWTGGSEFLVAGVPIELGTVMLNLLVDRAKEGGWRPTNGELVEEVAEGYVCKLATMGEDHECNATRQLVTDSQFRVLQLLLPDRDGRLPDDPACSPPMVLMQVVPGSPLVPLS